MNMNININPITIALTFGVLVLLFAVGYYVIIAWTEPGAAPPGANVPTPINVGIGWQEKGGGIALNTAGIHASGLIIPHGNVGIGTTALTHRLHIRGGHGDSQIRLHADNTVHGAPHAHLAFWASEPGITWQGTGIGHNVTWKDVAGWGPRLIDTTRPGFFIRSLDGNAFFGTVGVGNVVHDRMVITTAGNVGIGTTAPWARLDVHGGDVRIATPGAGLRFPDGTRQTTAAHPGTTFGFGGMYKTAIIFIGAKGTCSGCIRANPFTGACSCPTEYIAWGGGITNTMCLFICYR
jgi:hypothetical protein